MKKKFLFILASVFMLSCSSRQEPSTNQNHVELTPAAFDENQKISLSSFGSGERQDIINKMFDEALERNEELKSVNSYVEEAKRQRNDRLKSYEDYSRNNKNYWTTLQIYSEMLQDSILKNSLKVLIKELQKKHSIKTAAMENLVADIDTAEQNLNDLQLLMKIIVTMPMMSNYQKNELPNMEKIESIKTKMDSSIIKMESYSKIPF